MLHVNSLLLCLAHACPRIADAKCLKSEPTQRLETLKVLRSVQETGKMQLRLLATSHAVNHIYQLMTPVVLPEITREFGDLQRWALPMELRAVLLAPARGFRLPIPIRWQTESHNRSASSRLPCRFLAVGLTDNVAFLSVLFFVAGVGGSTYHPLGSPILAEAYPISRGRTLGLAPDRRSNWLVRRTFHHGHPGFRFRLETRFHDLRCPWLW